MEDKLLVLIALLSKYSDEHKDELISMFKKYINEDKLLKEMLFKLENTIFYHRKGEELYNQIVEIINNFISDLDHIQQNRMLLQNKKEYLDEVLNLNQKLFESLETNLVHIDFILKDNENIFSKYYKSFMNILIYLLFVSVNSDYKMIEYPSEDNASNLNDVIRNRLLPQFLDNENTNAWIISPLYDKMNDFKISIKYDIQYSNLSFLDISKLYDNKQYFAPNIFYDPMSHCVIGFGHIVSFDYQDSISMINSLFVRTVPRFIYKYDFIINNNPIHNLKLVMQDNDFIIQPFSYVTFLNSLLDSQTVYERKKKNQCFVCGKSIDYGTTCENHKVIIK